MKENRPTHDEKRPHLVALLYGRLRIQIGSCQRGTSMVEVVIATLLIGVVLVAALDAVGSAVKATRITSALVDGNALATSMMAEILAMPYEDSDETATVVFGVESDETANPTNRLLYDDIDDYHGWSSGPKSRDGRTMDPFSGWTRSVQVSKVNWQTPTNELGGADQDQGLRRITVIVRSPDGEDTILTALCSKDGQTKQTLGVDSTITTGVSIEMTAGGHEVMAHANISNHATGP